MKFFPRPAIFAKLTAILFAVVVIVLLASQFINVRPNYVYVVDIQMPFRPEMSDVEFLDNFLNGGAAPIDEARRRGISLPNNDKFILVNLKPDDSIELGREFCGTLADTARLETKLRQVFFYRERNGVIDSETSKAVKNVMLRAPLNTRYGSVIRVVDALKSAGADPIMLEIDGLAPADAASFNR